MDALHLYQPLLDILEELRAIRDLMDWQKQAYLTDRETHLAEQAEAIRIGGEMLEKAKQNAIEVHRQAEREHEERYHGRPKQGLVS